MTRELQNAIELVRLLRADLRKLESICRHMQRTASHEDLVAFSSRLPQDELLQLSMQCHLLTLSPGTAKLSSAPDKAIPE